MSDTAQGQLDLDTLTDDEVNALTPEQVESLMTQESPVEEPQEEDPETPEGEEEGDPDPDPEQPQGDGEPDPDPEADPNGEPDPEEDPDPEADPNPETPPADPKPVDPKPKAEEKPKVGEEEGTTLNAKAAIDFFTKVSKPFKADGKDVTVRSPEDAIRLMQMGVNYSRRMQEMKPMKAMDQMLKSNGLNSPEKMNFLIDLSKGKPEAIQKLLKDHKIDPIDLDVSDESKYTASNYAADPKDMDFKEAIETTMAAEGGTELIQDINKAWDLVSKEALRDQPAIFENILAQKQSGVYGKVKTELDYQRSMGYLTDVPFLQAYHQVATAMQNAGVFKESPQVQSAEPKVPVDTGPRKAARKPKTEQPNPNLSSITAPRAAPSRGNAQPEPDYSTMTDAQFLALSAPN